MQSNLVIEDIRWYSPLDAPFSVHGLCRPTPGVPYHRLPDAVAAGLSGEITGLRWNTAGGRVRFATDSPYIAIHAVPYDCGVWHQTYSKCSQSGFDLYRDGDDGVQRFCMNFMPPDNAPNGCDRAVSVAPELCTCCINLPLYDGVRELYIGLARSARLEPARPYRHVSPVVFYGSSITQGTPSRPGNTYQAFIEREYDTDYVNLGFSGSALGQPEIAEYAASLEPSVFVCDYDYNAPTPDFLRATHEPFYRTFRALQPDTPVVFVTRPSVYGYTDAEKARREIVYDTFRRGEAAGERVFFIDGERLFDGPHRDSCTLDGVHPNDLGYCRMARVIGEVVGRLI